MKKNSLSTAVVAGIAGIAGLSGMANAVNVNPDGLGQVLLYPYYTVNGGNSTLVSIVNTTDQAKAVKVRFLEALNSAEVLDFNLYLSPFDVWTAAVTRTADGAALFTGDTSCTVPNAVGKDNGGPSSTFKPFEFESNNPDIAGLAGVVRIAGSLTPITVAQRVRQGHVEVIEMGNLLDEAAPSTFRPRSWTIHAGAINNRTPNNCPALQAAWTAGGTAGQWLVNRSRAVVAANDGTVAPEPIVGGGGLFGAGTIVDVEFGRSLSYNADAIDGFYRADGLASPGNTLHFEPGDTFPNLSQARTSNLGFVTANIITNGSVVTTSYDEATEGGIKAVSAVLMSRFIYNEYNMQTSLSAASEWVVTFPTKRLHTYDHWLLDTRPFSDNQDIEPAADDELLDEQPFDTVGICETYIFSRWDREEFQGVAGQTLPIVSPRPPGVSQVFPQLCWESNVIAFNQTLAVDTETAVLGATPIQGAHGLNINSGTDVYQSGWARIEFNHPSNPANTYRNYLISDEGIAAIGLPSIGFWAADYLNAGVSANVRANYGGIHKHRAGRDGYAGAVDPGFGPTFAPLPLNVTGLASWTSSAP
jgi:hypothetical protein